MPDEPITDEPITSEEAISEPPKPVESEINKFRLEKIDAENVKKTDTREEVSVVNIPALQFQKVILEKTISDSQEQLDQINEVLVEWEKLPK